MGSSPDSVIQPIINFEKQRSDYDYTVITAAYNVEAYIEEAVNSVFEQTYLRKNKNSIQMVVLNDGSTDDTLSVLERLATQHANLIVINKENTGVSDTRNMGAKFARGKRWSFLDGDDRLDRFAIQRVDKIFGEHQNLQIVKLNRQFFEKGSGQVEYLMKDLKTSGIVDTRKDPYHPFFHVSSVVFDASLWEQDMFPTEIEYSEDAWVLGLMIEKSPVVYYSVECVYWYRRRYSENSAVDAFNGNPEKYIPQVDNYYIPYLKLIKSRFSTVSRHAQSMILYALSWNIKNKESFSFLSNQYVAEYLYKIHILLQYFDDELILGSTKMLNYYLRHALVILKHTGRLPEANSFYPTTIENVDNHAIPVIRDLAGNRIERWDNRKARIFVLKAIDESVSIFGALNTIFDIRTGENLRLYLKNSNGEVFNFGDSVPLPFKSYYFLNRVIKTQVGFSGSVPKPFFQKASTVALVGEYTIDNKTYTHQFELNFVGHFAWMVNFIDGSFFRVGESVVSYNQRRRRFDISKSSNTLIRQLERRFFKSMRSKDVRQNALKIYVWRTIANVLQRLKKRRHLTLNIYMDRYTSVWDNGTALILRHNELIKQQGNVREKNYFVLSKKSPGFLDLKRRGVRMIPYGSLRHKLLILSADRLISSQANIPNFNPFRSRWGNKLNDKMTFEFFYLQHGVSLRKTASVFNPWMTRSRLGIDHIVAGNKLEYDYLTDPRNGNGFEPRSVHLVGQARHDWLVPKSEPNAGRKKLVVMPTWRRDLARLTSRGYEYNPAFKESDHFKIWNEILSSEKLHAALDKAGVELIFAPHPLEAIQLDDYELRFVSEVLDTVENYNLLCNDTDAFLTDFSSVGMEYFYEQKPLFVLDTGDDNWENFDDEISYQSGYFGEVETDPGLLIDKIIESANSGFEVSKQTLRHRKDFYGFELKEENVSTAVLKAFKIIP